MSEPNPVRPVRKVAVADNIWEAFDVMSKELGTDRDGLVNQAMFMFARLNGFLTPGASLLNGTGPAAVAAPSGPAHPPPRLVAAPPPAIAAAQSEAPASEDKTPLPAAAPVAPRRAAAAAPVARPGREAPPPPVEAPTKVRPESDSDVKRRMAGTGSPTQAFEAPAAPPSKLDDDPVRREVAERVLETAAELERLIKGKQQAAEPPPPDPTNVGAAPQPVASAERALYLMGEDGELEKVVKERYLIGRGKHCDLCINSGKVSREHAAIMKEGSGFFIEDLGSSNGTWFNKQRIKRRQIEDGDEFFICSDKIKCVVR